MADSMEDSASSTVSGFKEAMDGPYVELQGFGKA